MLPFLIGITLFKLWPLLKVVTVSFQEGYHYLTGSYEAFGFGNYLTLFQDQYFRQAMVNTGIYVLVVVLAVIGISLPIAWCMLRVRHGLPFFQIAIFMPFITSDIAIGMAWRIIFSNNGILNHLLSSLGFHGVGWLTEAGMSLGTLILYGIWSGIPMTVLIFYCALLNIDPNIFIAARTNGAGEMKIFRKIVLPMMSSSITMVFAINSVSAWLTVNGLFPLFMGQPGPYYNLYTVVYYIYDKAQQGRYGFASACAASCVLLILVGLFQLLRFLVRPRAKKTGRGRGE
jgi:multiple sugar transport system permease protein